ncbi:MAG: hypothetical protein RL442_39 [Pseudomonadota bacterium]|jgi:hypothetical protein
MKAIKIVVGAVLTWALSLALLGAIARATWEMLRVGWDLL